jgi:Na+/H+ antiporter NhaD/arsenite permease-like protein
MQTIVPFCLGFIASITAFMQFSYADEKSGYTFPFWKYLIYWSLHTLVACLISYLLFMKG